jgi:membrane associated rhomboid family serine protease
VIQNRIKPVGRTNLLIILGKLVSYIDSFEPSGFQDRAIVRNKKICKPAFGIILLSFVQFIFYVIDYWQISNKEAKLTDIFRFQPYCKKTEIWRYFTYMFVHDQKDKLHLTINLVIQLIVGFPLEMIHGLY